MAKRLHTTVEEDASTKARLCGLSAKLEAAGAERLQLEHRLKLQRLEQAKAMNTLQVGMAKAMQGAGSLMLFNYRQSSSSRGSRGSSSHNSRGAPCVLGTGNVPC